MCQFCAKARNRVENKTVGFLPKWSLQSNRKGCNKQIITIKIMCYEKRNVGCPEGIQKGLYMSVGQSLQIHGAWDKFNHRQLFWPAPCLKST